jgi:hypothetical protein
MEPKKFDQEIDPKTTVANPGLISFAHNIGSAVIRPEDAGKIKHKGLTAMRQQADRNLKQLYEQMQLLVNQANSLQKRLELSERIYMSELKFEPVVGNTYYLYKRADGVDFVSMVAPDEWGRSSKKPSFLAKITLLADYTWEISENTPR